MFRLHSTTWIYGASDRLAAASISDRSFSRRIRSSGRRHHDSSPFQIAIFNSIFFEEIVSRVFDAAWFSSHPPWPKAGKSGTVSLEFCQDAGKEEIGQ